MVFEAISRSYFSNCHNCLHVQTLQILHTDNQHDWYLPYAYHCTSHFRANHCIMAEKTYLHFFISTNGNYLLTIFRVKHAVQTLKSHKTLRCKHTCRYPVWQTICNPTSQDLLWRLAHTVSRTLLTDLLYNVGKINTIKYNDFCINTFIKKFSYI